MTDWTDATCAQTDGDLWFSPDKSDRDYAVLLCGGCPALARCRAYTEQTWLDLRGNHHPMHDHFGVWAGHDYTDKAKNQRAGSAKDRAATAALLAAAGHTATQIASRIHTSERTVYRYLTGEYAS